MATGASMHPLKSFSQDIMAAITPSYYPPAEKGLRGKPTGL